jgi:hypothetical protein
MAAATTWQKVFDRFDADESGRLDVGEVKEAFKILLGVEVPAKKFDAAMAKFDITHDGKLDVNEFGQLVADLRVARKEYVEPAVVPHEGSLLGKDRKLPLQDLVLKIYNNKWVMAFVAFCIVGNFFVNILEKQIDPKTNEPKHDKIWATADITFNVIFLFELIANMWSYGGPVKKFWSSGWNVFDTLIVAVGVLTMANILGPPLDKLKLMRAFRVFRLFKRVEALNKIIVALLKSIPGVINAFIVLGVFFCIYAILAVELFREFGEGGIYTTYDATTGQNVTITSVTSRGFIAGIEYYGTFSRALYTLFQVMTGESWSEAVVRPLVFGWNQDSAFVVGAFFVTFIILTNLVLINVVVAVLLENFVTDDGTGEDQQVEDRLASFAQKEASGDMQAKVDQMANDMTVLTQAVLDIKASVKALQDSKEDTNSSRGEVKEISISRISF